MAGYADIDIVHVRGVPAFQLVHDTWGVDYSKIFGATKIANPDIRWYYPAYHPVSIIVLDDLAATSRHYKFELRFSEAAQAHVEALAEIPGKIAARELPENFEFKTKPYQHQLDGLVHLYYNMRSALFYACGLGKGLPVAAPILTPQGWRAIGSLAPGDCVVGGTGRLCTVMGVFPQGEQPLNEVTFTDGTVIVCDDAHLWKVQTADDQHRTGAWKVLSAADLRQRKLQYGSNGRRNKYRVPDTPVCAFPHKPVPVDPYVLGALLGDGSLVRGTPLFSSADEFVVAELRRRLPAYVKIKKFESAGRCPTYTLSTNGRSSSSANLLVRELDALGVWGRRSWQKHVPARYLFNSQRVRLQVLQGLMDTDGCVATGGLEFSSTSQQLAEDVAFLVRSLGGTARVASRYTYAVQAHTRKRDRRSWRVRLSFSPGAEPPFLLPRKRALFKPATRGVSRRIKTVVPAGVGETVCIQVDSPDSCFITENFIVTHNTKTIIDWHRATGCWPLILCPRIAVHVWSDETKVHGIDQEYLPLDAKSKKGKLKQIEQAKDYDGLVVTYDTLRLYHEHIAEQVPYDAIVADESQKIKSVTSGRTKTALEIARKAARRVIMSGTPSLGDPRDIYPQYRFLATYFMPWNAWHFKNKFCVISPHNKHIVTGFKNLEMLKNRINIVSIRRTKEECLDLPERTIQDLTVELTKEQTTAYNTLVQGLKESTGMDVEEAVSVLAESKTDPAARARAVAVDLPHTATLINKLIQVSCGFVYSYEDHVLPCDGCERLHTCVAAVPPVKPWTRRCPRVDEDGFPPAPSQLVSTFKNAKAALLKDLLTDILQEPSHKVIVWGQFRPEMDIIEDVLKESGWGYVRVDGRNSGSSKKHEQHFNSTPECRVYLGQVATGVAITLNSAQYTVYFSLPWNYEHYAQSIDRNHRVGQANNVTVYRLLAPGVDVSISAALATKHQVAEGLIDKTQDLASVSRTITKVGTI